MASDEDAGAAEPDETDPAFACSASAGVASDEADSAGFDSVAGVSVAAGFAASDARFSRPLIQSPPRES
jgi:hypothetical protein